LPENIFGNPSKFTFKIRLPDVVEAIDKLDGRASDMSVDIAWIKTYLEEIKKLLETINDKME
jgi:hypothetical protein